LAIGKNYLKNVIFIYTLIEYFQFQPNLSKKLFFMILPIPVPFTPPFAAHANIDAIRTPCQARRASPWQ